MDDRRARELLTDELKELDEQAARRDDRPAGEDERRAVDDVDRAAQAVEAMEQGLVESTSQAQRERVLDALARLDRGEYGRCSVCGRDIDDERLAARPETDRCRDHADR